eukprot:SAG22_NODE_12954_length_423_cov_2.009259_1_plen_46_part_10
MNTMQEKMRGLAAASSSFVIALAASLPRPNNASDSLALAPHPMRPL